ncbi:SusC/RagA family TonB-linked outer membrane protein [Prolixibacteraceae bacterium JC049]|nr:SusC/RagA family TonB-linked outer membrane protein [Prolixibacteraceae bacterium JC049]
MKNNLFHSGIRIPIRFQKTLLIMKLTGLFILLVCLQASAVSYAQSKRISINAHNLSIRELFEEIEEQSDFTIFYKSEDINLNKKVNIRVKDELISNTLTSALKNTNLTYTVKDKVIVILSQKGATAMAQQQKKVTGKVTDKSGESLPGVSVIVKGTTIGITTDIDGNYSLTLPADAKTLQFSFVGMKTTDVEINGQSTINLVLEEDAIGLDEVVAVGYGTQKKVNLTGAVTSVKTENLHNMPVSNLSNTMAGRAPGVQVVNSSGLAGASSSIRIRGSLVEPLYVINGVISSKSDFDALDATEVESINFLKDAATSSIYGSKAGNGVVLVKTKGGNIQKPQFEYRNSFSTSRTTKPVQRFTASQELEYVNRMMETRGQPMPYGQDVIDYFADKNYDINDLIWQNPSVQQHNLSVRGGSERINYYLSLGYHTEEGSYKNLEYNRYNFRSDVTAKISNRFKVNVNLSGNERQYDRWYWPYDGAEDFNVGDFYRATFNMTRLYPYYVDENGNPSTSVTKFPVKTPGGFHVPELMFNGGYRDINYKTLNGIIKFDLDLSDFVEGLSTSLQANYTVFQKDNKAFVRHNQWYIFQTKDVNNKFIPGPIDPTKTGKHNLSAPYERIEKWINLSSSYQINWFVNYDRTFGDHSISALGVYERAGSKGNSVYGKAEQLLSSTIDQIYNTSSDTEKRYFSGGEGESARESWIGRLHYTFSDKYIAEFSFRYDGNYRFAPSKRWGFFPSGSVAWRISQENFMQDIDWLSNLKLRASYGTTGSDKDINGNNITPWQWSNVYRKSGSYVFGGNLVDGLVPGKMPNPDITWATQHSWNIGLEYGILNNKLSGEFDIFGRKEKDLLGDRMGSTPTTLGASLPDVNYAERTYKGIDLMINWKDQVGELKYGVYANMGYAIDQWDVYDEPASYSDGTYANNWRSKIGKPRSRVYGLISKGIIRTQEQLDALPEGFTQFGREPKLGTLLFEDIRGANLSEGADGKIDGNDRTYLSDNGAPRINYGFGFNLEWKNFTVDAHFQGVGAYDRMIATRNGGGVFQVDRPYFEIWKDNYWTPENPNAKLPRIGGNWRQPEYGGDSSTFWMRNGAYLRLKNLNIGYTLPKHWFDKLGLSKVQLFVNGTNLFFLSDLTEHDPEQATLDSYPVMKTFTGGLNINF